MSFHSLLLSSVEIQMSAMWCTSLLLQQLALYFYSILEQFCLYAIYLLILSTQLIANYRLRSCIFPKAKQNLLSGSIFNRLLSRWRSRKYKGSHIKANFFLSSFSFVSGNISIKEGSFLSFYHIQRSYGTLVTNFLFLSFSSNKGPDDSSYWWKQKLVIF